MFVHAFTHVQKRPEIEESLGVGGGLAEECWRVELPTLISEVPTEAWCTYGRLRGREFTNCKTRPCLDGHLRTQVHLCERTLRTPVY